MLARWLHELGEILYFQDNEELNDTVILKPQWVTEYISKVLESKDVINRKGIFTRLEMNQLWCDLEPSMRDHFLHLMERFDLSYRTQENRDLSLVVERLPLDAPNYQQKWQQIEQTGECNEISMKFQLDTIPAGIPTWFIARQHRFTTGIHWRNGVLFAYEQEHLALVEAVKSDRYIKLTVRGRNPLNFFVLLRDGIEVTLARFPGLDIQRTIPCLGHNGQPCTHEFDYSGSPLDAIHFDLSPNLSPFRREALKSYSPSLVGKGLGVRSVLHSTEKRYINNYRNAGKKRKEQ